MTTAALEIRKLGFPWETTDPFLTCVYHLDSYPAGDERLGPAASLEGRRLGSDFEGKDGWRMYHGLTIPGFPQHPHRGFETVTIMRRGSIDHSDSLGGTARFGPGDVQWLTAGKGIVHSEMFPLLRGDAGNPLELFQVWLNLPRAHKLAEPHFSMLWREDIPVKRLLDAQGRATEATVIAGRYEDAVPPNPPPASWASDPAANVAIWTIRLEPNAEWTVPPAHAGTVRTLYFFKGAAVTVDGREAAVPSSVRLDARSVMVRNGREAADALLLQGRPLREPVAQYGPFVMNTPQEVQQAFTDYRRTQFGGWPWPDDGPVHSRESGRFARRPGGSEERPAGAE